MPWSLKSTFNLYRHGTCTRKMLLLFREKYFEQPHLQHRGEAVLRKHLRTFEENQISNIIRRTKGKRTLKFHEFYNIQRQKIPERIRISLENHSSSTENSKKRIFLNEKPLTQRRSGASQHMTKIILICVYILF